MISKAQRSKSMRIHLGMLGALLIGVASTGCAISRKQILLRDEDFVGKPVSLVNDIPFIEQPPQLCGPSALYMVAKSHRTELQLEEVTRITFTPQARGSYKQDMLSGARRLGMAPYKVRTLSGIFDELAAGRPVLVFHRTGFMWKDYWHYSVLTGYDRRDETFTAHIGPYSHHEMDISDFVHSWEEGDSWAYVILRPQDLPTEATFEEALANGQALLRLRNDGAAHALAQAMTRRWPERSHGIKLMTGSSLRIPAKKNRAPLNSFTSSRKVQ